MSEKNTHGNASQRGMATSANGSAMCETLSSTWKQRSLTWTPLTGLDCYQGSRSVDRSLLFARAMAHRFVACATLGGPRGSQQGGPEFATALAVLTSNQPNLPCVPFLPQGALPPQLPQRGPLQPLSRVSRRAFLLLIFQVQA